MKRLPQRSCDVTDMKYPPPSTPVLNINDHATGGRRTKDILGGPKGWGPKKKVANIEIYVIFEVFAFCGRRTKTDFKDRGLSTHNNFIRNFFVVEECPVPMSSVSSSSYFRFRLLQPQGESARVICHLQCSTSSSNDRKWF